MPGHIQPHLCASTYDAFVLCLCLSVMRVNTPIMNDLLLFFLVVRNSETINANTILTCLKTECKGSFDF